MALNNIDDVIARLDEIVAETIEKKSRAGFFAALYRQVTLRVKAGIDRGEFQDNVRMDHLDVVFASRYFDAYDAWQAGERPSKCWRVAFKAVDQKLTILQHLLLGINAHINLDLGIAAAEVSPGGKIVDLKDDFYLINRLLKQLLDPVQDVINDHSPLMSILDSLGGNVDEMLGIFSIEVAREESWELATDLAAHNERARQAIIRRADKAAAFLGRRVAHPGKMGFGGALIEHALEVIDAVEDDNIPAIIRALDEVFEKNKDRLLAESLS